MLNYYILGDSSTVNYLTASIPPFLSVEFLGSSTDLGAAYNQILVKKPDMVFIDEDLIHVDEEKLSMLRQSSMLVFTSGRVQGDPKMRFYNPVSNPSPNSANADYPALTARQTKGDGSSISVQNDSEEADNYIIIRTNFRSAGGTLTVLIKFSDIIYIKSLGNYLQIYTEGNKHFTSHMTLKAIADKLPAQFERINKAYLINLDKVTSIEGRDHVILNQNAQSPIPIGCTYQQRFAKWKKQYRPKLPAKNIASIVGALHYVLLNLSDWCEFYL
ncbi:LytTr DNA-binding domain-containing protein [Arcticibacter tournemirensis]|uniref:LytTR family transcriptional regulator n=1 Tax=Arcticibacter tournemirensis TaxID=699437 RepID=A0A5M9GQX0_9SPHI|nr:response regulator transcription factor [Arcticibacter tournemirensis]KAA8476155.1 LytTR family transcriptional regulator [Arcticibacter tournemirensis]TQM50851.1 LytTr DNA-binding domain-containing protein [Arcticibacter tournemirensis]